jgi:hypothetical protein
MYERDSMNERDSLMADDLTPQEREHLRDAWESLEPDDALEGIVVDAARDVPPPHRRSIPLWLPAVGLAAAVGEMRAAMDLYSG